jgi:hypothetical protein
MTMGKKFVSCGLKFVGVIDRYIGAVG